ncbi:MAG: methylated-DNA--[protein]-cysteine S-methyltransferase, partial [Myxococcales bacterium]|nr:methylated-DNA--[protein]-cysteine S-methyltransferase [Myxococcales bacterium]
SRITDAIYEAGFNSTGRFYEQSKEILGMTPSEYRKAGSGQAIQFAVAECSLGHVLVAATEIGVCAVLLGDEPQALIDDLEQRFSSAKIDLADPGFEATVEAVISVIEAPSKGCSLPLDIRGTAFQNLVWRALRSIPPGQTLSYSELASALGKPTASRAVAGACAANQIAVLVPCHRIVRGDGSISGYRWGVQRKKELLRREALE